MVAKNFVVDFLGKSAGTLTDTKRKESLNSGSYPKFIDTLNSAVDKNSIPKSDRSIQRNSDINEGKRIDKKINKSKDVDSKADESGSNNEIKSYKDAVKENEKVSVKKEDKSSDDKSVGKKIDKTNEKDMKEIEQTVEETVVEESLAGILNISVEELKKVLSALNISSEDLTNESKITEIAAKISDLFGLSSDQKETLAKIAQIIVSESKSLLSGMEEKNTDSTQNINKDGWVKLEGVDVEVVEIDKNLQFEDVGALGNKLKEILNKLENKLESEPEKLLENISEKVEEIAASNVKTITVQSDKKEEVDDFEITISEDNNEGKVAKNAEKSSEHEEQDTDTSSDSKTQRLDLKKADTDNTPETNTQDTQQTEFNSVLNNQQIKMNGANEVTKVQSDVTVSKKEIITQIVEKAKVVLTDEKSEMVIDLKPDHLGKLSLKVVTERGAVVAKFVAESEQVKAAIESNMDNLKESLTKQGFSVQGFSVSVGQDSRRGFDEGNDFSKNNRTGKGDKALATASVGVSTIEENHQRLNPYMVKGGSINLTA